MFYSYKNCLVKVNGDTIAATDASLSLGANIEAGRTINEPSLTFYAPNRLNNTLNINYFITGIDTIKQYVGKRNSYISGNIGGIWFNSGAIASYSIAGKANEPLKANVQILFFEEAKGEFSPTYLNNLNFNDINLHSIVLSGNATGIITNPISLDYKAEISVLPQFETDYSEQGYRYPTRIQIDKTRSTMTLVSDNLSPYLPFTGQKTHLNVLIFDNNSSILSEAFTISGSISSKGISVSNDIIYNTITIQEDSLLSPPEVTGVFEYSEYPLVAGTNFNYSDFVVLWGNNLDSVDSVKIGGKEVPEVYKFEAMGICDIDKPFIVIMMPTWNGELTVTSEVGSSEFPTILTVNDLGIPEF